MLSLGAIEHIETGPEHALAEHRRVLREGGRFVITLPRLSWVKRLNDLRLVGRPGATYHSPRDRWVERCRQAPRSDLGLVASCSTSVDVCWVGLIEAAGFRVRSHRPIGVGAGLGESRWVRRYSAHRADLITSSSSAGHRRRSRLRRYWSAGVHQNPATPGESAAAYLMAGAFGHMVFIVADAVPQVKTASKAPAHPATAGAPFPFGYRRWRRRKYTHVRTDGSKSVIEADAPSELEQLNVAESEFPLVQRRRSALVKWETREDRSRLRRR